MGFALFKTKRDGAPPAPELYGIGEEIPVDGLQPGLVGGDGNGTGGNGSQTIVDDNLPPGDIVGEFLQHHIDDILPQIQHLAFHSYSAPDDGGFSKVILRGPQQAGATGQEVMHGVGRALIQLPVYASKHELQDGSNGDKRPPDIMRQDHHHVQNLLVQPPNALFGFKECSFRPLTLGNIRYGGSARDSAVGAFHEYAIETGIELTLIFYLQSDFAGVNLTGVENFLQV